MCQYSATDGVPNNWHLVHLGSRAVGGAGLVISEATAVTPDGRISPADTGIWNEEQVDAWTPIARFIEENGAVPGIQLAHAGRKAGTQPPWHGGKPIPGIGWDIVAPSPIAFAEGYPTPRELTVTEIHDVAASFGAAAERAMRAGFRVVEIHAAHGYLINEFMSPLSNQRTDEYGGTFDNRIRLLLEVVDSVKQGWSEDLPLFVRISATDWIEGGWTVEDSGRLALILKSKGVDLIDCSSGGNAIGAKIPPEPGYQVPLAAHVKAKSGLLTAAVGLITEPSHADTIVRRGEADVIFLARESLRDPYWPRRAAVELNQTLTAPPQYLRAW